MSDDKSPIYSDGWKQWSNTVMGTLKTLEGKIDRLDKKITSHREETLVDIATLKAKAGIMGTVSGFIASAIMSLVIGIFIWQLNSEFGEKEHSPQITTDTSIGYVLPPREETYDITDRIIQEAKT